MARSGLLFVVPPLAGLAAGYLTGGRARYLAARLPAPWLLGILAAGQILASRVLSGVAAAVAMSGVAAATVIWLVVTLRRHRELIGACAIALFGAALNAVAIAANHGMPYARSAAAAAGLTAADQTVRNVPAGAGTRLALLGDVIPITPLRAVVSVGDIVLAVGVATLVAAAMRSPAERREEVTT